MTISFDSDLKLCDRGPVVTPASKYVLLEGDTRSLAERLEALHPAPQAPELVDPSKISVSSVAKWIVFFVALAVSVFVGRNLPNTLNPNYGFGVMMLVLFTLLYLSLIAESKYKKREQAKLFEKDSQQFMADFAAYRTSVNELIRQYMLNRLRGDYYLNNGFLLIVKTEEIDSQDWLNFGTPDATTEKAVEAFKQLASRYYTETNAAWEKAREVADNVYEHCSAVAKADLRP